MSRKIAPLFFSTACLAFVAACSAGAEAPEMSGIESHQSAGLVQVEDFTGILIVKTGKDMKFDAKLTEGALVKSGKIDIPQMTVSAEGIHIVGDDDVKINQCKSNDGKYRLKLKGDKLRPLEDYPRLEISMPSSASLDLALNSGYVKVDDILATKIVIQGCGDAFLNNVANNFVGDIRGSGDISVGNVGEMSVDIKGSGDVNVGSVAGKAMADIKGSGDVVIGNISGEFYASIKGSGDVFAKSANKKAIIEVRGSGDVEIADGKFESADVNVAGSGDILIDGEVVDLNVMINGSGDVDVRSLTGELTGGIRGSGDLKVNGEDVVYKNGRWYLPQ